MRKIFVLSILTLIMTACGYRIVPIELLQEYEWGRGMHPESPMGGTAWGSGSFETNGEQIYFTGTNLDGERIFYLGGPSTGMMMGGYLSCASCHGIDGKGGEHFMHMETMNAPDIRWEVLQHEEAEEHSEEGEHGDYDIDLFRKAVVEGQHPDGKPLSRDMPRWEMSDEDLADLIEYLKNLP